MWKAMVVMEVIIIIIIIAKENKHKNMKFKTKTKEFKTKQTKNRYVNKRKKKTLLSEIQIFTGNASSCIIHGCGECYCRILKSCVKNTRSRRFR